MIPFASFRIAVLSLTIVVVVFHQSSSLAEHLSLIWSDLVNGSSFNVILSVVVCITWQTLETLKYPLHSLVENDQIETRSTNSIDDALVMSCTNIVSIDNTSRLEKSIQTASRTKD